MRGKISNTAVIDKQNTYVFCPNDLSSQHVILVHELVSLKQFDVLPIKSQGQADFINKVDFLIPCKKLI